MIDLSQVEHHPAVEDMVEVLCNKTNNTDHGFFRPVVAYFLAKMAATMRASVKTATRGDIPVNMYTIALATSGYGKGHSIHLIEQEFLSGFKRRFMDNTFDILSEKSLWRIANKRAAKKGTQQQEEFDKVEKEFRAAGAYTFAFDSGSAPAVKQLRNKLLMAECGSINLQIDEIGSNLTANTEVLNLYLELYDQGIVKQKLTKNTTDNTRLEELDGKSPANLLLFGTPSMLFDASQTEALFYDFLKTGYARRTLFGLGHEMLKASHQLTPEETFAAQTTKENTARVSTWRTHFHKLADPALFGWEMLMPEEVEIAWIAYRQECERLSDNLPVHEEIHKAELSHRYFKALKLAGTYAFIDMSNTVEMEHLNAAIKLVEESGASFRQLLRREKNYEKLAKFIATSGRELTHADLNEELPYYGKGHAARNEMMMMAQSWGYPRHIVIKKQFRDGIEVFTGETLEETDLNDIVVSYSDNWAYNYGIEEDENGRPVKIAFDQLHQLTQAPGMHWTNHHFKNGHRAEENVIPGFNMVVIDVDGGVRLDTVHELLKDYRFLTYTTKRHTEGENRFRLMLPINYRLKLEAADYKEFMNSLMQWLPFPSDDGANQRSKKWESFDGGTFHYNSGELLDALQFIPRTSRNDEHKQNFKALENLDNLERWFAQRIANGNRNNHMIKFALALVDSGMNLIDVGKAVHSFNKKLTEPLAKEEIENTIMVTVSKHFARATV